MKRSALLKLMRLFYTARQHQTQGFTLMELLIVCLIAGGIVAGLLFIVVELLGTDLREAARSDTQREINMALDYISTELREAIFVYTPKDLQAITGRPQPLTDFLPAALTANTNLPVLAFWKHQPFPESIRNNCGTAGTAAIAGEACRTGSSYALVVYSLNVENTGTWQGGARITRYVLDEFQSTEPPTRTRGYVSPWVNNSNFAAWPYGMNTATPPQYVNLQGTNRPNNPAAALVDFVDNFSPSAESCPSQYSISPPGAWLTNLSASAFKNRRSFYACIRDGAVNTDNQDVLLFLQGNARGKAGTFDDEFRPTVQTRVLVRGVLERNLGN